MSAKGTILVTGCSDGSLGSALALEFHKTGKWRVFASARNPTKLKEIQAVGIETIVMDVCSTESLISAVSEVSQLTGGSLDALINNAGSSYVMPTVDIDIAEGKKLFDLNVWSVLETTQVFLSLLMKSKSAMIVNHCSAGAVLASPPLSCYAASKLALTCFTETMRRELEPFGIKVVALMTGVVKSNIHANAGHGSKPKLPENSIYNIAREAVESGMDAEKYNEGAPTAEEWARQVVQDLSKKDPPLQIWRGKSATAMWAMQFPPRTLVDGMVDKISGMDVVREKVKEQREKEQLAGRDR